LLRARRRLSDIIRPASLLVVLVVVPAAGARGAGAGLARRCNLAHAARPRLAAAGPARTAPGGDGGSHCAWLARRA
jgi:hypothetical protein